MRVYPILPSSFPFPSQKSCEVAPPIQNQNTTTCGPSRFVPSSLFALVGLLLVLSSPAHLQVKSSAVSLQYLLVKPPKTSTSRQLQVKFSALPSQDLLFKRLRLPLRHLLVKFLPLPLSTLAGQVTCATLSTLAGQVSVLFLSGDTFWTRHLLSLGQVRFTFFLHFQHVLGPVPKGLSHHVLLRSTRRWRNDQVQREPRRTWVLGARALCWRDCQ